MTPTEARRAIWSVERLPDDPYSPSYDGVRVTFKPMGMGPAPIQEVTITLGTPPVRKPRNLHLGYIKTYEQALLYGNEAYRILLDKGQIARTTEVTL